MPPPASPNPAAKPPVSGKQAAGGTLALAIAAILASVYANEGGYVNHPDDPGGATNFGVTEKVARRAGYQGDMRAFQKYCTAAGAVCADSIYTRDYIERPGFMPLVPIEPAVVNELVDTGANMGPHWPSLWFQQSLTDLGFPVAADGLVGPGTVAAFRAAQQRYGKVATCVTMLDRLDAKQRARYDRLVRANPRLKKFYRGWINHRIGNVDRRECGKGWA